MYVQARARIHVERARHLAVATRAMTDKLADIHGRRDLEQ